MAAALRGSIDEAKASVDDELLQRLLAKQCTAAANALVYFEIEATVIPSADSTTGCSKMEREKFGIEINSAVRAVGIDDKDAGTTMVGKVCIKPDSGRIRLLREFKRLLTGGWNYNGGGGCSFCNGDDDDGRRQLAVSASPEAKQEFDASIAPELEDKLEFYLNGLIEQGELACAGKNATVEVSIQQADAAKNLGSVLSCSGFDAKSMNETIFALDTAKEIAEVENGTLPEPTRGVPPANPV